MGIAERVVALPPSAQAAVMELIGYLEWRATAKPAPEDEVWSAFSLASAMRGMEDEESPYTLDDLKESFR